MSLLSADKTCGIAIRSWLVGVLVLGIVPSASAQLAQIIHFVAPAYPPLARQAMISGQVTLDVNVDKAGSVTGASESASAHPLLAQWAKECVKEWKFQSASRERKLSVVFYYGFSGKAQETNPKTSVTADFGSGTIRVFITTDSFPADQLQAFNKSPAGPELGENATPYWLLQVTDITGW